MSRTKQSRSMVVTVAVSAGALVYAYFVFLPMQQSIAKLNGELKTQQQFALSTEQATTQAADLERQLVSARELVADWRAHAPRENELGAFIGRVAELASESGATVQRLSPLESISLATLQQQPAELVVEGTFENIAAFVARLEQLPETVWITKLHVAPAREDGAIVRCELVFTVFADHSEKSD